MGCSKTLLPLSLLGHGNKSFEMEERVVLRCETELGNF